MKIEIEAFGYVGRIVGDRPGPVDVPDDGATIADVERALIRSYPRLAELADGLAYAIGVEAVPRTHRLGGGETVVVLSPVSGG